MPGLQYNASILRPASSRITADPVWPLLHQFHIQILSSHNIQILMWLSQQLDIWPEQLNMRHQLLNGRAKGNGRQDLRDANGMEMFVLSAHMRV